MHTIQIFEKVHRADGTILSPGCYLVEDLNCAELMVEAERGSFIAQGFNGNERDNARRVMKGNSGTLIIHPGGYGDNILLTPAIRALRRSLPNERIGVCCRPAKRAVFEGLGYPDEFVDYPLNYDSMICRWRDFDIMENLNEADARGRTMHATDLKAEQMGVAKDMGDDRKPEYRISPEEMMFAVTRYPRTIRPNGLLVPRLGIQLAPGATNRTPTTRQMGLSMAALFEEGWEIMVFGSPGSIPREAINPAHQARIKNLAADGLTFRQSAAVAKMCDVLLTPDSSLMHIAGALDIPCVALFGPIDWKVRTAYYPTVRAIQGHDGCDIAPCFFHQRGGILFPREGPCRKSGMCDALASISLEVIVQKIKQLIAKGGPDAGPTASKLEPPPDAPQPGTAADGPVDNVVPFDAQAVEPALTRAP